MSILSVSLLKFSLEKSGIGILLVSMTILLLIIAYRKLLAHLGKGNVKHNKYCILYRIERQPAKGEIEFYFTTEDPKTVTFELLDNQFQVIECLANKEFSTGGHIIRFDSTKLENGIYYYQLKTENQKTYKKIEILN